MADAIVTPVRAAREVTLATPVEERGGLTPVLTLYRAHVLAFEAGDWEGADAHEMALLALPSVSPACLAAKMLARHRGTDLSCLAPDDPVWVEARRLVGVL